MTKKLTILIFSLLFVISLLLTYLITEARAATCFKKGEYTSGFNKICIYDCLGSDRAITIKNVQLCPLTIQG